MKRREFIALMVSTAALPRSSHAQRAATPTIGLLHGVSEAQWADRIVGFRRGLGEAGFAEDRNVSIESRWAEGHFDRLPAMAADLVRRKVAVICAGASDVAIRAAIEATNTIPIVFTTASDPIRAGFVGSFNRPGANVTGATFMGVELVAKRFELMRETVSGIGRIALLVNPNNPGLRQDNIQLSRAAVERLGLELVVVEAGEEGAIEPAVAQAAGRQARGLIVGNDAYLSSRSRVVAASALRHGLPTMSESRDGVRAGLLMSYGPNQAEVFRQAGKYVGRILKGEHPADLPVIQPSVFELFINLTTARTLGIQVPDAVVSRADEMIE